MFEKILIANRGEIACRIVRSCRRLGIATVAVFSEADAQAEHVRVADQAFLIGPAPARESYLRIDRIIEAARASAAQAIHPGYGFLSEREAFAAACAEAGIVFIGPPIEAIRAMGSKSAAKHLMEAAGVPLVPGYHGDEQTGAYLEEQAAAIGFPILIKASAGGGGKGMRVVERRADFASALASCQREAKSSFGDDRVLLERYLQRPRHLEIQVFADTQGQVISLFERDCSAQRRHQKVIEEAPAPHMAPERRAAMGRAACAAARAVGYVGAGTVEFIAEPGGEFYFMEMNTRLQVEHPVTEMITGLDLVEWQLRVAAGEPLPSSEAAIRGHSIEVRVYAEDPDKGFLPSIGRLQRFRAPAASAHVRIDTGVAEGDAISPYYDPMLAKLIVWDETRELACRRMLEALRQFQVVGVHTNIDFLARLVNTSAFRQGEIDTGFIERETAQWASVAGASTADVVTLAAVWTALRDRDHAFAQRSPADPWSPWDVADGWRLNANLRRVLRFQVGEASHSVTLEYTGQGLQRLAGDGAETIEAQADAEGDLRMRLGGRWLHAIVVETERELIIFAADGRYALIPVNPVLQADVAEEEVGGLVAPMPGKIIALLADRGASVDKGAALLVMEAMKMEHTIYAPAAGVVRDFRYAVGELVPEGAALVDFEPVGTAAA